MKKTKSRTVTVRIEDELNVCFEQVCNTLQQDKSEFLRTCISKFCDDNRLLFEHQPKLPEYINYIKKEMLTVPNELLEIRNGSWDTANELAIIVLADTLWSDSNRFWDCWERLCEEYEIEFEDSEGKIEEFTGETLLTLEDLGMLLADQPIRIEVSDLLKEEMWADDLELKKTSLVITMKKAIEENSARTLIEDVIEKASRETKTKMKIAIDLTGKFTRTLQGIDSPVQIEEIKNT